MQTIPYREQWQALQVQQDPGASLSLLSRQVALAFVHQYYQAGHYRADYIDLLCEMATTYEDTSLCHAVCSSLFGIVVERLCDDFEDMPLGVYTRVMSQVITYCRQHPAGRSLDEVLTRFGIHDFSDLYQRSNHVHVCEYTYDHQRCPRRIVCLSRVTIGADVAILSVIIQRVTRLFPEAEVVVVGDSKLHGVLGGHPQVRLAELTYSRRGDLFARFSSWFELLTVLEREMRGYDASEVLVIDPDSRLTQLAVLPVTHRDHYLFFNTRVFRPSTQGWSMSERANRWINGVFNTSGTCTPRVWIPQPLRRQAKQRTASLRGAGCRRMVAVNLGFGGNDRKQLGLDFEKALLHELLAAPGTVVLLDRGFGTQEQSRCAAIVASVTRQATAQARLDDADWPTFPHGVIAVTCSIGEMAALIAESDEFIGYDSACQHIAAACDTPVVTVFAGTNNQHFVQRWTACGSAASHVVHVDTLTHPGQVDVAEVLARIRQARRSIAGPCSQPSLPLPVVCLDRDKTPAQKNPLAL